MDFSDLFAAHFSGKGFASFNEFQAAFEAFQEVRKNILIYFCSKLDYNIFLKELITFPNITLVAKL